MFELLTLCQITVDKGGSSVVAAGASPAATVVIAAGAWTGNCTSVFFVNAAVHALDDLWFECKALLLVKVLGLVKLGNHFADNAFDALLVLWWNVIFARDRG